MLPASYSEMLSLSEKIMTAIKWLGLDLCQNQDPKINSLKGIERGKYLQENPQEHFRQFQIHNIRIDRSGDHLNMIMTLQNWAAMTARCEGLLYGFMAGKDWPKESFVKYDECKFMLYELQSLIGVALENLASQTDEMPCKHSLN